ncbi:SGNH/GDSL hydrolase family protein [Nocardiopsis composta]|uniref:Lysophospholipase L1-like esterase n=1 Tax=Nocardiopsis composta TaxID=157465 RepID=A0A7W8VBR6_9ACTN|nr:SGNH/GDSL hydrolase family protein [Nocardiopsis composta]MBB5430193.1 lysophospholipase L1-like esterase [Nocardiopsis composta]
MGGRRIFGGLAAAFTALGAGWAAAPAHASGGGGEGPLDYVALGDSAAAGPLIPDQDPNLACLRSDRNYPAVVAEALGADLTDVTCSGARLSDLSERQYGLLPPQYRALDEETDLVTITIGGNDVDLVTRALTCLNFKPEPYGISCEERLTSGGDRIAEDVDAWEPEFGAALARIGELAPDARIVVAGYGHYIREGGCWPDQPIWGRDGDYLQRSVSHLNDALERQAGEHGAEFVDLEPVSEGHDVCAAPGDRYLEGLVPTSPAMTLHPNARGMAAFGGAIAESLGAREQAPLG